MINRPLVCVLFTCFVAPTALAQAQNPAARGRQTPATMGAPAVAAPRAQARLANNQSQARLANNQSQARLANNQSPAARAAPSDRSRYRYHEGRWWYWLPEGRWAIWGDNQWKIYEPQAGLGLLPPPSPAPWPRAYLDWRGTQYAGRFSPEAASLEAASRRETDAWRKRLTGQASGGVDSKNSSLAIDSGFASRVDSMQDRLSITPYDYRIGQRGHGLFEANPDRTIFNSGKLNYATSSGGYMGNALRGPFGY